MFAFTIIWTGQLVSLLGTAMTAFALIIWVWQITGEATALALMAFFQFAPLLLMIPIAGALVDRWNRKLTMMLSDLAAGLGTIAILLLFLTGVLEIWHLYAIGIFIGTFGAFQWPAYSAAVTMMVDKKHYARASGMMGMTHSISGIFGPPLAAVLLVFIGIAGILVIDIITFSFAVGVLLFAHIPQPPPADDLRKDVLGVLKDSLYGFRYILDRRPLLNLQLTFFTFNLVATFGMIVMNPMILARTGSNEIVLGSVQSAAGVGGAIGGILLAVWGGPKRKINGLLGGMVAAGIIFGIGLGIGRDMFVWMIAVFLAMITIPTLNGSSQSIWQSKVPANKQGRVFAARAVIAQMASVFAMLLVGPLADQVFEPAMMPSGALAEQFGWLVGTGPGSGMALMMLISGLFCSIVALIAFGIPSIRDVEKLIPDHDMCTASENEEISVVQGGAVKIRKKVDGDFNSMFEIAKNLPEWFDEGGLKTMQTELKTHGGFAAFFEGALVGFVTFDTVTKEIAKISWMGVRKELHRKGIGSKLLRSLEEYLIHLGYGILEVDTVAESVDYEPYEFTRNFYYKHEFKKHRVDKDFYGQPNNKHDRLVLRKHLKIN
jgi:MFS family permease/ribosomal protein S18 acetylase RimI-like enzyme